MLDAGPEEKGGGTRSYWLGMTSASMRSKRRTVERTPRSEWTAIPVPLGDSGPDRGQIERARKAIADNRVPSKVGDYEYELSRGFLFCADCGRAMVSYAHRFPTRTHHYYRCDQRHKARGTATPCPNRRSHPAVALEYEATRTFEQYANRETMLALYDEAVARQDEQIGSRRILEWRAALVERSNYLELERKGYLRQNARGVLSDADLDAMLSEVDEQREAVAAELRATEDASAAVERLKAARASLLSYDWPEDPDGIHPSEYLTLAARPEEIRRAYRRYGARFEVDSEGDLTLRLDLALDGSALHMTSSH